MYTNNYAQTRYYGATNHRGARIRVYFAGQDGRTTWRVRPYDYAALDAHASAVADVFGEGADIERDWESTDGTGRGYSVTINR